MDLDVEIIEDCLPGRTTNVDDAHIPPIYDAIPQETSPEPDTPHLHDDESGSLYEIPSSDMN